MFCKKCGEKLEDGVKNCPKCGCSVDDAVNNASNPSNGLANADGVILPASILRRLSNYLLDSVFSKIIFWILLIIISSLVSGPGLAYNIMAVIVIVFYFVGYNILCESVWGRTLGKLITDTKVVDKYGKKPSFLRVTGRSFARIIPFDALSFLFGSFPVGWHDSISGTFVVPNDLSNEDAKKLNRQEIRTANKANSSTTVTVILVVVVVLVGIAILGILSSVVLASLSTAREKGTEASISYTMKNVQIQSVLYQDKNNKSYVGFCKSPEAISLLDSVTKSATHEKYDYICNDSKDSWAVSYPLITKKFLCVDSSKDSVSMLDKNITTETVCSTN
ncbi:MAG: RDD family protein [bacterium]